MIDWLFGSNDEKKDWTYDRAKVPLQSPPGCSGTGERVLYPARVRYTEDEIQMYSGVPRKNIGWHSVESENLKFIIRQQI